MPHFVHQILLDSPRQHLHWDGGALSKPGKVNVHTYLNTQSRYKNEDAAEDALYVRLKQSIPHLKIWVLPETLCMSG